MSDTRKFENTNKKNDPGELLLRLVGWPWSAIIAGAILLFGVAILIDIGRV